MKKVAKLKFSSSKRCFISLPRSWGTGLERGRITVFEITGENGLLYLSWSGDTHTDDSVVEINGLFANKQGFQIDEEVLVSTVDDVPTCVQAYVEPLSIDDWEILELQAQAVESNLLNQVRAVWTGQILPVWVQKTTCVFVKIGSMTPACKCSILEERTEVIISPKLRHQTSVKPRKPQTTSQERKSSRQETSELNQGTRDGKSANLNARDEMETCNVPNENQNVLSRTFGYLKSFFYVNSDDISSAEDQCEPQLNYLNCEKEISTLLRIQPLGNVKIADDLQEDHSSLVFNQPTNVYINQETVRKMLKNHVEEMPVTFLASLCRQQSPKDREELLRKKMEKSAKKLQKNGKGRKAEEDDPLEGGQKKDYVIVRVIVVVNDVSNRNVGNTSASIPSARSPNVIFKEEWGVLDDHIMIHDLLRKQIGLEVTGQVELNIVKEDCKCSDIKRITVHPLFERKEELTDDMIQIAVESWFQTCTSLQFPLVASQGTMLSVPLKPEINGEFLLTFPEFRTAQMSAFTVLYPQLINKCTISTSGQLTSSNKPACVKRLPFWSVKQIDPQLPDVKHLGGVKNDLDTAVKHLASTLGTRPLSTAIQSNKLGSYDGGLLITGPRGIGKTCMGKAVLAQMAGCPHLCFVQMLQCRSLRGKQLSSIKKTLERVFNEAYWRAPSVILLDDLDLIAAAPSGPEQEMAPEALYYSRVAQVLKDVMKQEQRQNSRISIMATCKSRSSVHSSLVTPRGNHFFTKHIELKPPGQKQRKEILQSIIENKSSINYECVDHLDLDLISKGTEGHVARDLNSVVERAVHAHRMLHPQAANVSELALTTSDLSAGLRGFTPASLRSVSLHQGGDTSWQDIGGLHPVRKALVETLQWPAKYPVLFASCPLRLRSGLLLYGAPGTGKTLLAGAVAKETGLRFISIKGPELLSKYIGASEQAVRDTFLRAQSAKPCILFFDEFDSLAPRRGHDSTGVTDRVVNQLLTQLDGVEGLEGVYVLAATSRPDLIDPALLRPGRLDKALLCGLPDAAERREILKALTRNMSLAADADLDQLADECEHFTGADFKALLYNAQLEAIHETAGYHGLQQQASASPSLNSLLSNGSWEKIPVTGKESISSQDTSSPILTPSPGTSPREDPPVVPRHQGQEEQQQEAVVLEKPLPRRRVNYLPSLEEGAVEISQEVHDRIVAQVDSLLGTTNEDQIEEQKTRVCTLIQKRHLQQAASTMAPSVSEAERRKYHLIYENFVSSRGGDFGDGNQVTGKRATLA